MYDIRLDFMHSPSPFSLVRNHVQNANKHVSSSMAQFKVWSPETSKYPLSSNLTESDTNEILAADVNVLSHVMP